VWRQVDLKAALVRLEEDQTKNSEARTIPLPDVLVKMLKQIDPKEGEVFDRTNLRKEWCKACVAAGLGTLTKVEGKQTHVILGPTHNSRFPSFSNQEFDESWRE